MNAITPTTSIAMPVGPNPLSTPVEAFRAEPIPFNADDDRPDRSWNALRLQLAHRTPECASDEGAFAAPAFVARELDDNLPNEPDRFDPAVGRRLGVPAAV